VIYFFAVSSPAHARLQARVRRAEVERTYPM
jgi:hypothetical protein